MQHLNCRVEHLPVSMLYEAGSWFIGNTLRMFQLCVSSCHSIAMAHVLMVMDDGHKQS